MIWYSVKFKMKSWVASAWQADTIFGHLCWGLLYLQGIQKLQDFLDKYKKGQPPLLLSNGFPGDFLPAPLLPVIPIDHSLSLEDQKLAYEEMKTRKKARFLSLDNFNQVIKGQQPSAALDSPAEYHRVTVKNQINRLTDTTGQEVSLYNFPEQYSSYITIYVKVEEDFVSTARDLFQYIADTGYGKRKSIGYGQIEKYSFDPFNGFMPPTESNGFVSLSNFVPSPSDPRDGSWKTLTKYGKMGEAYSLEDSAFKKPLLMLEAGATFFDKPLHPFYGCLVTDLNPRYVDAVQYALALPVPVSLPSPAK